MCRSMASVRIGGSVEFCVILPVVCVVLRSFARRVLVPWCSWLMACGRRIIRSIAAKTKKKTKNTPLRCPSVCPGTDGSAVGSHGHTSIGKLDHTLEESAGTFGLLGLDTTGDGEIDVIGRKSELEK